MSGPVNSDYSRFPLPGGQKGCRRRAGPKRHSSTATTGLGRARPLTASTGYAMDHGKWEKGQPYSNLWNQGGVDELMGAAEIGLCVSFSPCDSTVLPSQYEEPGGVTRASPLFFPSRVFARAAHSRGQNDGAGLVAVVIRTASIYHYPVKGHR